MTRLRGMKAQCLVPAFDGAGSSPVERRGSRPAGAAYACGRHNDRFILDAQHRRNAETKHLDFPD